MAKIRINGEEVEYEKGKGIQSPDKDKGDDKDNSKEKDKK